MASGRVENRSDQPYSASAILPQIEYLSELDQFLDYNSYKKRFLWNGNADDLGKFIEDRVISYGEDEEDAPEVALQTLNTPFSKHLRRPLTSIIVRRLSKSKAKPVAK